MNERGSKPHKTVWVCYLSIPHRTGWTESYVSNVFASRETAVRLTREWLDPHHGEATVVLDNDDSSAYLTWPSGNNARINRYPVQV